MDSLKKATGVGQGARELYARAYEEAVLLGPSKFGDAPVMFEAAARKAAESGDVELGARATANARLYAFITRGDVRTLRELRQALDGLADIEQIGSRTETFPASTLAAEIDGRVIEAGLATLDASDHPARASSHLAAAEAFKRTFASPLATYRFQASDGHVDTAKARFFLHQGLASWHQAFAVSIAAPETAAEHMARALGWFRQCDDEGWANRAQIWLAACRLRRTCWMCHRELQGAGVHFRTYPATVSPYVADVVRRLGQDLSTLDVQAGQLVLCVPCGSVVERQADAYATRRAEELRAVLGSKVSALEETVRQLAARLAALERRPHT